MSKDLWKGRVGPYRVGLLFNLPSLWVGVHYSPYNKRYCINVLPSQCGSRCPVAMNRRDQND